MANVRIVTQVGNFEAKLENLSGKAEPRKVNGKEIVMKTDGSPSIFYRNDKGEPLSFCRVDNGIPIQQPLSNGYCNAQGVLATDVIPFYQTTDGEFIPAVKNDKTDVFEVNKWEPLANFTDKYIVDKYYQVSPSAGKSKKDYQRIASLNANTGEMKKLWDYMTQNGVVGRGILNITSSGYLPSIAYIRPVNLGSQWTIEIGIFKQQKRYTWLEEMNYQPKTAVVESTVQVIPSIDEI